MTIEEIVLWYRENVNYKIAKSFFSFLIKLGILKEDVNLDLTNLFLLERYNDEFVKENGFYKLKKERKDIINKFNDEETKINHKTNSDNSINKPKNEKNINKKFRIENLGNKKLKLVRL